MKKATLSFVLAGLFPYLVQAQDLGSVASAILKEGLELYRNELASWISTDSLTEQDRLLVKGYFTYSDPTSGNLISIYVDSSQHLAVKKFVFKPVSDTDIRFVGRHDSVSLSPVEKTILEVRQNAAGLGAYWYGQFGYSRIVNPNVIIHRTQPEYIVYVVAGTPQRSFVPIGGDLYLRYNANGKFKDIEPIHNNLIPLGIEADNDVVYSAHEHRGNRMDKEYITPTDICTLLLYRKIFKQDKHLVVSRKFISEFYFDEPRLVIRPNTEKLKLTR